MITEQPRYPDDPDLRRLAKQLQSLGPEDKDDDAWKAADRKTDGGKLKWRHLAGRSGDYAGSIMATNLKVSGVSVFSAGDFMAADGQETILLNDAKRGTYKKLVIADGKLTGAVLVGDTADALWYLELIRGGASIVPMRADIMFGKALTLRNLPATDQPPQQQAA